MDPSEEQLIETARKLAKSIEDHKMCESEMFVQISINNARELDKYNQTAKSLLDQNKVQSIIHPVLLAHVIREGQRSIHEMNLGQIGGYRGC